MSIDPATTGMPQPGDEGWETSDGKPLTVIAVNGTDVWASCAGLSGIWIDSVFGWPSWVRSKPATIFPERWIPVYRVSVGCSHSTFGEAVRETQRFVPQSRLGILHLLPSGLTEMLAPA